MPIADARDAVFIPAKSPQMSLLEGEVVPGVAIGAIIFRTVPQARSLTSATQHFQ